MRSIDYASILMDRENLIEWRLWQYQRNHNNAAKALIFIKGLIVEDV